MSAHRSRAVLAQNLFASDRPARELVRLSGARPGDLTYDLGAGTGRVTAQLLAVGARVVAVERDPNLAGKLRQRFAGRAATVVEADLATVCFEPPFKVVANLPFNRTAVALRRLLFETPAPQAAALVLQREAARKYAGLPRPTAVSLLTHPWFEARLSQPFARRDFVPAPGVDVALLVMTRRPRPLIADAERAAWQGFVRYALARPQADARRALRNLISQLQWRRLCDDLGIAADIRRDELGPEAWLAIFRFVIAHAPAWKLEKALRAAGRAAPD